MRREDAPPAGWYPDPQGGARLRWWEGTDWADRWRAPPTPGVKLVQLEHEDLETGRVPTGGSTPSGSLYAGMSRADSQALVEEIRKAARSEVERAAQTFGREARSVADGLSPLITSYTNTLVKWFRRLAVLAIVLVVLWLAFQLFAQATLFEWIGDRIDNLTDNLGDESGLGGVGGS